jgi:murein DD-endopeptidase MepM/ murein hydrolase activator NlpD
VLFRSRPDREAVREASRSARPGPTRSRPLDRTQAPATARSRLPTAAPPARSARKRDEGWVWPAHGPLTTYFGEVGPYSPRGHAGIDIAAPMGAPVVSVTDGTVVTAARDGGYGIYAVVDHHDGTRTLYAHLSRLDVGHGDTLERGQLLGRIGSTGYSTGPHLHFEVRTDGGLRNPLGYLP